MDIKIGEQPNINISLTQSPPINIKFETTYLRGGDFVGSSGLKYIEPMSGSAYENLLNIGAVRDDTLYVTYENE